LLSEVKNLLTTRSRLKTAILDEVHANGIEIVSPNFMNQRVLPLGHQFIPELSLEQAGTAKAATIESVAFDKADKAESLDKLRQRHAEMKEGLSQLEKEEAEAGDEEKAALNQRIEALQAQMDRLAKYVTEREQNEEE
jgi:hypothetical protein